MDYLFTTLNPYIDAERASLYMAAEIKKRETWMAKLLANGARQIKAYPVDIVFQWFCTSTRTDPDNIAFAQKFILDGLVKAEVLKDDSWKYIASLKHEFNKSDTDYVIVDIS